MYSKLERYPTDLRAREAEHDLDPLEQYDLEALCQTPTDQEGDEPLEIWYCAILGGSPLGPELLPGEHGEPEG